MKNTDTHSIPVRPGRFHLAVITILLVLVCAVATACSRANATPVTSQTKVTVIGEASLKLQPDAAVISVSVVTQNTQAQVATQQNAGKSEAVGKAVQEAAGADAELKTTGYSLQPQQNDNGKTPRIVGYEARNTVTVTISDLTKVGVVIDAASKAGANSIEGVSFILRDNNSATGKALADATSQAMTKARAIAQAMGGKVLRVVEEQEQFTGGVTMSEPRDLDVATYSRGTPVRVGPITLNSRVQLIVEVDARP